MQSESCLLCHSKKIKEFYSRVNDHISGDAFKTIRCSTCGIHFLSPVPDNIERYYPISYRAYSGMVKKILFFFFRMRVNTWLKIQKNIAVPVGTRTALEIGCGSAVMLQALHKKGWHVLGIERNEKTAAQLSKMSGIKILSNDLADLNKDLKFDLIILFNVLEHMKNPMITLKECARRLKTNGIIIINTPNINSWQARFSGHLWFHLDPPRHLFLFTPESIKKILKESGLKFSRIDFISIEHDPFGWAQSIINKIFNNYNILTRYLMGFEKLNQTILFSIILAGIMLIPSIFLSAISWIAKKGAIMQVIAIPDNHIIKQK